MNKVCEVCADSAFFRADHEDCGLVLGLSRMVPHPFLKYNNQIFTVSPLPRWLRARLIDFATEQGFEVIHRRIHPSHVSRIKV